MRWKMERTYFLKTDRIGFSKWTPDDIESAKLLWGDPEVTRYLCAGGTFGMSEITDRLHTEIRNESAYGVQYWPIFERTTGELIGCCGLRPHRQKEYEIGFHLRPEFWGQGYAREAAGAVIEYAFTVLKAEKLFAGHNPENKRSGKLLRKLGFVYIGDEFYEPTGLYHPSYELENQYRSHADRADNTADLEKQFHQEMADIYVRAKRECGYNATRFLQLITEKGGVEAARRLISKPGGTDGFAILWECGRLDLSVEAHVLKPEFEALFTEEERRMCRERLEQFGWK